MQGKVFATEEERLQAYDPDSAYRYEEEIHDNYDNHLQSYIENEFNDKNTSESKIIESQNQGRFAAEADVFLTQKFSDGHQKKPPNREGSGQAHQLLKAIINGVDSTIFLDYGSNLSWICQSRVNHRIKFPSSCPTVIKGLGHQPAASITQDAIVNISLPSGISLGSVCCGVVPDNLFPGHLVLGRTLFHAFGVLAKND
ncbi:hypothetical protein GcM3_073031 [Golovinomyces cichoracearum]|uniref:Uncharacterized protein n=1 Tax=Golovinomyces cichoracearum TaxID=62708 RepID=A0A420IRZ7_9PEZI|nr:hypothetical protein GcM3_073031 [Golovinomyces cichoracearum]